MRRNSTLIALGVFLIGLSAAWFLTPVQEIILGALGANEPPSRDLDATNPGTALELVNTGLNAINALFAAAGVYLAAKGYRLQPPGK